MAFNIGPTLLVVGNGRFSKTARSNPVHREARRRSRDGRVLAVVCRRLADNVAERATKRAQARKADVEANVGDAAIGLAQQVHRTFHAASLEVAMRRLTKGRSKRSDEVRLRD